MNNMTFFICLFLTFNSHAKTSLLLVGGGKRPITAMEAFVKEAGGNNAFVVILPWASETTEGALNIQRELTQLSNGKVEIASTKQTELNKQLSAATGLFFTGGDQNKLMHEIKSLNLKQELKTMYKNGVAFAGTSAGTAIMSERMINGEGDTTILNGKQIGLSEGLGLLPESVIVDQHFIVRSRYNRLAGVVLHSGLLGIAVDENNAIMIKNNSHGTVFGPTQVLFLSQENTKKLSIDIYEKNEKIDLKKYSAF